MYICCCIYNVCVYVPVGLDSEGTMVYLYIFVYLQRVCTVCIHYVCVCACWPRSWRHYGVRVYFHMYTMYMYVCLQVCINVCVYVPVGLDSDCTMVYVYTSTIYVYVYICPLYMYIPYLPQWRHCGMCVRVYIYNMYIGIYWCIHAICVYVNICAHWAGHWRHCGMCVRVYTHVCTCVYT